MPKVLITLLYCFLAFVPLFETELAAAPWLPQLPLGSWSYPSSLPPYPNHPYLSPRLLQKSRLCGSMVSLILYLCLFPPSYPHSQSILYTVITMIFLKSWGLQAITCLLCEFPFTSYAMLSLTLCCHSSLLYIWIRTIVPPATGLLHTLFPPLGSFSA